MLVELVSLIVGVSTADWLERLVSEVTGDVLSGRLNSMTVEWKINHSLKSRETRSLASCKEHWVFCI